jgi:hypothetical protein
MIKLINILKENQNSYVSLHAGYYTKDNKDPDILDRKNNVRWKSEFEEKGMIAKYNQGANGFLNDGIPIILVSGFKWTSDSKGWVDVFFRKKLNEVYLERSEIDSIGLVKEFKLNITSDEFEEIFPYNDNREKEDITLVDLIPYGYNPTKISSETGKYYGCYVWDIKPNEIIKIEKG